MNYEQALCWVHALPRTAPKAKLQRMRRLMSHLGNPQDKLDFVHVAGTNGKGSTVVMLAAVLAASGLHVGANVSPFVLDFCERFQIGGKMAPRARVAQILSDVRTAAEEMDEIPLEFEAVTAAAFLYFWQEKCDIVCLEAGIGGRSDYTNIICRPKVVCLTRIGLDHMELLGESVEAIAAEKSGIIKAGCTVVSYPCQVPAAAKVICQAAKNAGCTLNVPLIEELTSLKGNPFENKMTYQGREYALRLPGVHQQHNALMVIEAARTLRGHGFAVNEDNIIAGLATATMPARIEVLSFSPLLILDGSHNEDSGEALAQELQRQNVYGLTAVVGMLRGKQAQTYLQLIAPHVSQLYAVRPDSPRALSGKELAELAHPFIPHVILGKNVDEGTKLAVDSGANVLVGGSLYLASEVRPLLLRLTEEKTNGSAKFV